MTAFTVIGGHGFIGSRLVAHLNRLGYPCQVPARGEWPANPGHVVYAAGLTGDFRQRPYETVRAHVSDLAAAIECRNFESFLYLSSARVYAGQHATGEDTSVIVSPRDPEHLYNLSKLMGESVCLSSGHPTHRVARLSNVYGPELGSPMFLDRIVRAAVDEGRVALQSHPDSAKDYVHVDDVVSLLARIVLDARQSVYNVASGVNVTNRALLARLQELTQCRVELEGSAEPLVYPPVDITRIRTEFSARPRALLAELPGLVASYQQSRRAA